MPEALILEFTGVTAYPKVQRVPLLAYHQPGA
jgi:hypothetical protein